jgi:hypothetical protein
MRIKIINFQIVETYVSRPAIVKFWQRLFGVEELDQYHFDTRIKIDDLPNNLKLNVNDIIQLPNAVKLIIWSVDRGNMIKAKTFKMAVEDLRNYHPIEMHLVYPRSYTHISDRHAPRL